MLTIVIVSVLVAAVLAAARSDLRRAAGRYAAIGALCGGADTRPAGRVECHRMAGCAVLEVQGGPDNITVVVLPAAVAHPDGTVTSGDTLEVATVHVTGNAAGRVALLAEEALVFGTRIDLAVEKAYLADGSLGVVAITATSHDGAPRRAATVDAFPDPQLAGIL